jgi:hypothetical protein
VFDVIKDVKSVIAKVNILAKRIREQRDLDL